MYAGNARTRTGSRKGSPGAFRGSRNGRYGWLRLQEKRESIDLYSFKKRESNNKWHFIKGGVGTCPASSKRRTDTHGIKKGESLDKVGIVKDWSKWSMVLPDDINPQVFDRQERFIWWYARLGKVKAAAGLAEVACGTVGHWRRLDRYGIQGRMDDARVEFLRKRALVGRSA